MSLQIDSYYETIEVNRSFVNDPLLTYSYIYQKKSRQVFIQKTTLFGVGYIDPSGDSRFSVITGRVAIPRRVKRIGRTGVLFSSAHMTENKTQAKILVIRFSSVGDIILTTPVFRYLRRVKPGAEIHFLTRSEFAGLLANNPSVDKIIAFNTKEGFQGLRLLKNKIKSENYDEIFDLHGSLRSRYISLLSGCGNVKRIKKNQLKRFLLIKFRINLYHWSPGSDGSLARPLSAVEKYLISCGYKITENQNYEDLRLDLFPSGQDLKNSDTFWKKFSGNAPRILMAPGARHFTKRWPPEYYAELAALLYKKFRFKTAFAGGPDEVETVQEIIRIADPPGKFTVNLAGRLSLTETSAVIARSSLFISNDSGLMHMAAASQRHQICIFGSTVRELGFFPINPRSRIIETELKCRPCSHIGRKTCPKNHLNCLRKIKPIMVLQEIQDCMTIFNAEKKQKRK